MSHRIVLQTSPRQTPQNSPAIHDLQTNVVTPTTPMPGIQAAIVAATEGQIIAAIDRVLAQRDVLWKREYARQYEKWCMVHGAPSYTYSVPNLTAETNEAIRNAATAVMNGY